MNKHKTRLLALLGAGACLVSSCNLASETATSTDAELLARANAANNSVTATNTGTTTPKTSTTTSTPSTAPKTSSTTTTPKVTTPAPAPAPAVANTNTSLRSSGGVLTIPASLNSRVVRVQVIHTRNGYHPAFAVSGVQGAGIANGFQWINYGKNPSGVYNAGKPLSAFPKGRLGGALWLVSGDRSPPFASDGNLVVAE